MAKIKKNNLRKKTVKKETSKKTLKKTEKKAATKKSKNISVKINPTKNKQITVKKNLFPVEGDSVKSFSAPMTSGKNFNLSEISGQGLVLYFYPKDATPGCTLQGHEFTKLRKDFLEMGYEVYGISRDSIKSHEKFKEKECYNFELISDEDEKICKLFNVIKEKNMYGKKVMGIERSTFIISKDGRILKSWRGVKAEGNALETLEALRSLS